MTKKQFLAIFRSQTSESVNNIIEQDLFVTAMVLVLLRTLNSDGHYMPTYDSFDEKQFMDQLCNNLGKMTVKDFGSKVMSKKSEQLMKKSNAYLISGIHDAALFAATTFGSPVLSRPLTYLDFYISKKIKHGEFGHSMFEGHSISSLSKFCVGKFKGRKMGEQIGTTVGHGEDYFAIAPDSINSSIIGWGSTGITATADILSSAYYSLKMRYNMFIEKKSEQKWLEKDFIATLRRKLRKKASDKQTLYKMLLFANEYVLLYSINV